MKRKKIIKWLTCFISLGLFVLLSVMIAYHKEFKIDTTVYNFMAKFISDPLTFIVKVITNFGGAVVLILLAISSILVCKNKKNCYCICLNLALAKLFNIVIKMLIERPRPAVMHLVIEKGYSFPSGHTMVSMAFYGFIIYLIYQNISNKKLKLLAIVGLSILIGAIGISRVYLGVHYITDVIGAWICTLSYLIIYITIVNKTVLKQ